MNTFTCPKCEQTYAPHWRASDGSGLCRTCEASRDGWCRWADEHPQHFDVHPCSGPTEEPGGPCRYCGQPIPESDPPCRNCWQRFDEMPFADVRATFAELGLDTTVTRSEP